MSAMLNQRAVARLLLLHCHIAAHPVSFNLFVARILFVASVTIIFLLSLPDNFTLIHKFVVSLNNILDSQLPALFRLIVAKAQAVTKRRRGGANQQLIVCSASSGVAHAWRNPGQDKILMATN